MKILLISSPHHYLYSSRISNSFGKTPPINLACLAAFLIDKGIKVEIFDPSAEEIELGDLYACVPRDFDIVGVSSFTPTLKESVEILRIAKKINSRCIAIMGGAHISALPRETMSDFPGIDYGIVGEGELTLYELIKALQEDGDISKVKGIIYRSNKEIIFNGYRERIVNLDSLPFPAYNLLDMKKYRLKLHHIWSNEYFEYSPYTNLFTSRGCPKNCTFCGMRSIWGNNIYLRSAEKVLDEVDILVNKYNIRCIEISDSCLLFEKTRTNKLLDGLILRDYDVNFSCMLRVDSVDEETLRKMRKAKFRLLRFGVESGCQQILDAMNKGYTISQIEDAFKIAHRVGIAVTACVIVGYPGETKTTFKETMRFLKKIKPTAVDFYVATPLVGTQLFRQATEKGYISNSQWANWSFFPEEPVLNTPELSSADLMKLFKKAYSSFYFSPHFVFQCIKNLHYPGRISFYYSGFRALILILLKKIINNRLGNKCKIH